MPVEQLGASPNAAAFTTAPWTTSGGQLAESATWQVGKSSASSPGSSVGESTEPLLADSANRALDGIGYLGLEDSRQSVRNTADAFQGPEESFARSSPCAT